MIEALSPELEKTSEKMSEKIISALRQNPSMTIAGLARRFGVATRSIERHLRTLQANGGLRRIGARRGGQWEVLE